MEQLLRHLRKLDPGKEIVLDESGFLDSGSLDLAVKLSDWEVVVSSLNGGWAPNSSGDMKLDPNYLNILRTYNGIVARYPLSVREDLGLSVISIYSM